VTRVFAHPTELIGVADSTLGPTDWLAIEQSRIDAFAEATGDHQWIHVDAERASRGPFGTTIAHGYLTLSLVNYFLPQLMQVEQVRMGVNYGLDRVRFPAPLPVNSRIRGRGEILTAVAIDGGVQVTVRVSIERAGGERAVCVADTISRFLSRDQGAQ